MEYKEYQLIELTNKIFSGGTPKTKEKSYWGGKYKWLSSGETSSDFIEDTEKTITEEGIKKSSTKLAYKNDVVIASAGQGKTRGQTSLLLVDSYINQSVIAIRANEEFLDYKYLYYNLKMRYKELRAISDSTSTRGSLSTKLLKELKIKIPTLDIQNVISNVLYTYDKKIEINKKIISNLEAQAQALFKYYFVDFEPFVDGNFVDSELGQIPEGWKVIELGNIFEFKKGKKPKKESMSIDEGVPYLVKGVVDGKDISEFTIDKKIVYINELDIFMLMDGANSGNIYYGFEGALGSTFSKLELKDDLLREVLYQFLLNNLNAIKNQNTGSAIPHANKDFINKMLLAIPDEIKMENICKCFKKLREMTLILTKQNQTLAYTRDALLPKLMAGEIDLENLGGPYD